MNRRQVIQRAKYYMDALAGGVDPISEREIEGDSVLAEERIKKCFSFISDILDELLKTGGRVALPDEGNAASQYELVRKKAPFQLPAELRHKVHISPVPLTPQMFVNNINHAIDTSAMEKLSTTRLNAWLVRNEYVKASKQLAVMNRTVMKPQPKAAEIGLVEGDVVDSVTGEVRARLELTQQAQVFILEHLDDILKEEEKTS